MSTSTNSDALPLGVELLAIAGDARKLLDDRIAATDDAVDERRLADVRPSDDRDHGGRVMSALHWHAERGAERDAVGGDDLDRAREIGRRRAVEELSL